MKIEFARFSPYAIEPQEGLKRSQVLTCTLLIFIQLDLGLHIIRTEIGLTIPRGYFGKVHPRSNCTRFYRCGRWNYWCRLKRAGVSFFFFNFSDRFLHIEKYDRFCQMVFQKIVSTPRLIEVEKIIHLTKKEKVHLD